MARNNRRRRHRILALVAAGVTAAVVALLVVVLVIVLRAPSGPVAPPPPSALPPTAAPPSANQRRPQYQDASCPDVHISLLAQNNTRLWVFSPSTLTCSDPAAMIDYCDQAQGSNRAFYQHYRVVGGHNGHFDMPPSGNHDWSSWGPQLAAMAPDIVATIR